MAMLENAVISATEVVGPLPPLDKHNGSHGEGSRAMQPYMLSTTTTKKYVPHRNDGGSSSGRDGTATTGGKGCGGGKAEGQRSPSPAAGRAPRGSHEGHTHNHHTTGDATPGSHHHTTGQHLPSLTQQQQQQSTSHPPRSTSFAMGEGDDRCGGARHGGHRYAVRGRYGHRGRTHNHGDNNNNNNDDDDDEEEDVAGGHARHRSMRRRRSSRRPSCRVRENSRIGIGTVGLYAAQAVPVYTRPAPPRSNSSIAKPGTMSEAGHADFLTPAYTPGANLSSEGNAHLGLPSSPNTNNNTNNNYSNAPSARYHYPPSTRRPSRSNSMAASNPTAATGHAYYLPACYFTPRYGFMERWAKREEDFVHWKSDHLARSLFYTYKDGELSGTHVAQLRESEKASRTGRASGPEGREMWRGSVNYGGGGGAAAAVASAVAATRGTNKEGEPKVHCPAVMHGRSRLFETSKTAQTRSKTLPSRTYYTKDSNNNKNNNNNNGSNGNNCNSAGAGDNNKDNSSSNNNKEAAQTRTSTHAADEEDNRIVAAEGDGNDGDGGSHSEADSHASNAAPAGVDTAVLQRFERKRLRCIARKRAAAEAARTRRVSRLEHKLLERRQRAREGQAIDLPEAYYATVLEAQQPHSQQQTQPSHHRPAPSYHNNNSSNTNSNRVQPRRAPDRPSDASSLYDRITARDHHRACLAARAQSQAVREHLSAVRHEGRVAMRSRIARELQAARQLERDVRAAWMEGAEHISRRAAAERHAARAASLQEQSRALHALFELERRSYALIREQEDSERAVHQRWLRRKVPVLHHTPSSASVKEAAACRGHTLTSKAPAEGSPAAATAQKTPESTTNTTSANANGVGVAAAPMTTSARGRTEASPLGPSPLSKRDTTHTTNTSDASKKNTNTTAVTPSNVTASSPTRTLSPRPVARISPAAFGTTSTNFLAEVKLWQASFASPNATPPCGSDPIYRREWLQQLEQERQAFNTQTVAQWRAKYPACIAQARESNAQAKAKAAEEQRLSYTRDMQRLQLQQADNKDYVSALHDLHADQLTRLRRAKEEQTLSRRRAAEEQRSAERMNETLTSTLREKEAQELHELVSTVRQNSARSPSPQHSCASP